MLLGYRKTGKAGPENQSKLSLARTDLARQTRLWHKFARRWEQLFQVVFNTVTYVELDLVGTVIIPSLSFSFSALLKVISLRKIL